MYSIVMCMALGSAVDLPDCHRRRGGCFGCYGGGCWGGGCGGWGCGGYSCGGGYSCCGGTATTTKEDTEEEDGAEDESARLTTPARVVVNLPAKSKLTINDRSTRSEGARRQFVTGNLKPGKTYTLRFKATIKGEDGDRTAMKVVKVRAGQRAEINIAVPKATASLK